VHPVRRPPRTRLARWHMDAGAWWADMERDNELTVGGYRVLRFPAFAVRDSPDAVARQLAEALRQAGWAGPAPGAGRPQ
jgi:hypothetical protein